MAQDDASAQANRSGMDPVRLTVIFYLGSAIAIGLFMSHLIGVLWANFGLPNPMVLSVAEADLTTVLGFAVGIGAAIGCWVHPLTKRLSLECATELMKVTWPSWPETRVSTMAVVGTSLASAAILFAIDQGAYHLMVEWLPKLWSKF